MASEMIERATKAILEASRNNCFPVDEAVAGLFVRAVIEAMREPTVEMKLALGECGGDTDAIWPAMIDAALAEPLPASR